VEAMRRRPRVRLTALALALAVAGWAGLVAVGFAFDAVWPDTARAWRDVGALCCLVTALGVLSFVVLAGQWELGYLAPALVALFSGIMLLYLLTLGQFLFRGRLRFDQSASTTLVLILVAVAVWAVAARMGEADPDEVPPGRVQAFRVAVWLALLGLGALGVWLAGVWL
jgi:hypothetical protein